MLESSKKDSGFKLKVINAVWQKYNKLKTIEPYRIKDVCLLRNIRSKYIINSFSEKSKIYIRFLTTQIWTF